MKIDLNTITGEQIIRFKRKNKPDLDPSEEALIQEATLDIIKYGSLKADLANSLIDTLEAFGYKVKDLRDEILDVQDELDEAKEEIEALEGRLEELRQAENE